jgi:hypothetical protein
MLDRLIVALVLALTLDQALAQAGANQETGILSKEVQQMLDSGGYSEVKILQQTLLVEAKDKNGTPVLLQIGGGSMTVVPIGRPQAAENHSLPSRQTEAKTSPNDASSKKQNDSEPIPPSSSPVQKQINATRRSPFLNPATPTGF